MKKFFAYSLLFSMFFLFPLAAAPTREGEGAQHLEQLTRQLSLKLLLREKERNFESAALPECRAAVIGEMRRDPKANARKKVALPRMERSFTDAYCRAFEVEAQKLFDACPGAMNETERKTYLNSVKTVNARRAKQLFPPLGEGVRQELVAEQRQKMIFKEIYPTVDEVEKLDDRTLSQTLLTRFEKSSQGFIMEENLPLVQKQVILPVVAEARRQQKLQKELLPRLSVSDELWEKEEIEKQLAAGLETALTQKIGKKAKRYPLFPATQKALELRAEKLPAERIANTMETLLDDKRYGKELAENTAMHRTAAESWKLCGDLYFDGALRSAMEKCKVPAGIKMDENALRQAFAGAVSRKFQPVRDRFAAAQLAQCRPDVAAWIPQMAETETFAANGRKTLPNFAEPPKIDGTMLAETEILLQKSLRFSLEKEADRLAEQQKAVETFYSEVAAECGAHQRKRQETSQSFWLRLFGRSSAEVTLPEIIKVYTSRIEKESSSPLFPSVEKEIDIRSRAILQQLQKAVMEKESAPQKQEKEPESIEMTFRLKSVGKELILQCGTQQWKFRDGALPAEEIKKVFASTEPDKEIKIKLIVSGDTIYYRTVAELRSLLKACAAGTKVEDSYQR